MSGGFFSTIGELKPDPQDALQPADRPQDNSGPEESSPQEAPSDKQGQLDPQQRTPNEADTKHVASSKNSNAPQDHADQLHAQLSTKMGVELADNNQTIVTEANKALPLQQPKQPATTPRLDSTEQNYSAPAPQQPINLAPTHGRDMPGEYFALLKDPGRTFAYNFSQEFSDPEGTPLTYSLSSSQNIDGVDIHLNSTTGLLTMTLGADLSTLPTDMSVQVIVFDGVNQTVAAPITFRFLESEGDLQQGDPFGNGNFNNPIEQILMESNHQEIGEDGANKSLFLSPDRSSNFYIKGDSNVIYVGENSNNRTVLLEEQATDNTIFGGSHNETFEIKNANNAVYGLDGDDRAVLHLDEINPADLGNLEIDLGHEDEGFWAWGKAFAAGAQAHINQIALENRGSFGDTLVLRGDGGSLDFSNVGKLRGLETLDLKADSGSQSVTLTVKDIFSSTDDFNTLVIRGDASDTVHFDTQGGGSTFLEQVTIEGKTYDAYSAHNSDGQAITLLVDADIGIINGL